MQIGKIADIFPKNHLKNVPCANIRSCFWLGVVIEFISSNWKVISTCALLHYGHFLQLQGVINEWTHTRRNCKSSRMHQYTRRQEVNKSIHVRLLFVFTFTISTLIAGSCFTGGQKWKNRKPVPPPPIPGNGGVLVTCIYITEYL